MSNVKQICLAVLMYTADYDERMPMRTNWAEAMVPYMKSETIFQCPSAKQGDIRQRTYAYNARLDRYEVGKVLSPAMTAMIFDTRAFGENPGGGAEIADARHRGGVNVGYVDGHAAWLSQNGVGQRVVWDPATSWPGVKTPADPGAP